MKILKTVLQSKIFFIILLIGVCIYLILSYMFINNSKYQNGEINDYFYVKNIKYGEDKVTLELLGKEKIIATIYEEVDIHLNDYIYIKGIVETPNKNTIPGNFNYKNYLKSKNINKTLKVKNYKIIKENKNIFYNLKEKLFQRCQNKYQKVFLLNDKNSLDEETYENIRKMGIIFLISQSGIHLSFLLRTIKKFFKKNLLKNFISFLIIIFNVFLIGFSFAILKCLISFLINDLLKIKISRIRKIIIIYSIILLINPFILLNSAFYFSLSSTLAIYYSRYHLKENKIYNGLIRAIYLFIFNIPLLINTSFELNFFSIILSVIMLPIILYFYYPFSIITFFISPLNIIYNLFSIVLDVLINILGKVSIFTLIFPKMPIWLIIVYYVLIIFFVYYNFKFCKYILIVIMTFLKISPYLNPNMEVWMLDVSQGDSIVLIFPFNKRNIMIDTGGNVNYDLASNIILFLKSKGISRIDDLILSHGDADHIGVAPDIVDKIKVKNVVFNCGEYNLLEKNLINKLENENINYYSCINKINVDNYKLEFLSACDYDNENDNSNVVYFNYNGYQFLFMGDAGIKKEKDILNKYNLKIDFLKVGHHGSNTSSSKDFINKINPKYALISVGKNNKYGHPSNETIDILKNSKIYRTDEDGSINIKLSKNGYKIKTCPP